MGMTRERVDRMMRFMGCIFLTPFFGVVELGGDVIGECRIQLGVDTPDDGVDDGAGDELERHPLVSGQLGANVARIDSDADDPISLVATGVLDGQKPHAGLADAVTRNARLGLVERIEIDAAALRGELLQPET